MIITFISIFVCKVVENFVYVCKQQEKTRLAKKILFLFISSLFVACFGIFLENFEATMVMDDALDGFSPVSTPKIFWKSRKRSASGRNLEVSSEDTAKTPPGNPEDTPPNVEMQDSTEVSELSERRKALFEPLEPIKNINGRRPSAESLLPPPDFESANYPKGWLIGKKRKLVNVDVVESMRRIAVQEMNRKDREIDGLNEQLEEDSRCLEHLQVQLVDERSKRSRLERENEMLQDQVNLLMNMLQETEQMGDEGQEVGDEGQDEP